MSSNGERKEQSSLDLRQMIQQVDASDGAKLDSSDIVVNPRNDILQRESLVDLEVGDAFFIAEVSSVRFE